MLLRLKDQLISSCDQLELLICELRCGLLIQPPNDLRQPPTAAAHAFRAAGGGRLHAMLGAAGWNNRLGWKTPIG